MYQAIDFYESSSCVNGERCQRGQMWWTCYPYLHVLPRVTRIWGDGSTATMDLSRFDSNREGRDERADTDPGEFLAVTKFKKRPVVILSTAGTPYQDRAWRGGGFFLVAPIRSLRNPLTGEYVARPEFVWGAITYRYSSVFFLPRSNDLNIREAVIHLDRMKTLHCSWLLERRRARLSQDAMICLDEWLHNYIRGEVSARFNGDLEVYREAMGESPQVRAGVFGEGAI